MSSLTETFNKLKNGEFISTEIMVSILCAAATIADSKIKIGLMGLISDIGATTDKATGKKVYFTNDIAKLISILSMYELGIDIAPLVGAVDTPVAAVCIPAPTTEHDNIYPVAASVVVPVENVTGGTSHILPGVATPVAVESVESVESVETPKPKLPTIVEIRGALFPHTGSSIKDGVKFDESMTDAEKTNKTIELVMKIFPDGGINGGQFTITWSNGNVIDQPIQPGGVESNLAFVLSFLETESRNIAANN